MTTATPTPPATGPVSRIDPEAAYRRPTAPGPALLRLDSNEGVLPPQALLAQLAAADPELLRRYPEVSALEAALAARLDVPPERLIVTAGADEAIDRACRAFLEPGKSVLLPDPCFDMFDRCAALAGGTLVRVPWRDGPFPLDGFLGRVDARTGVVVVANDRRVYIRKVAGGYGGYVWSFAKGRVEHRKQPHIVQPVREQTADQEFEAEVINALGAGVVALLFRSQPVMHNAVA